MFISSFKTKSKVRVAAALFLVIQMKPFPPFLSGFNQDFMTCPLNEA